MYNNMDLLLKNNTRTANPLIAKILFSEICQESITTRVYISFKYSTAAAKIVYQTVVGGGPIEGGARNTGG